MHNMTTHKNNLHVTGFIRLAPKQSDDKASHEPNLQVLTRRVKSDSLDVETVRLEPHLIDNVLRKKGQVNEIPIRLCFNKAENAIAARYAGFSADGQYRCEGDGQAATLTHRADRSEPVLVEQSCAGCESCPVAAQHGMLCRPQIRMPVRVHGHQSGVSGVFEVRTSSYYTWRALVAQLKSIESMFGGLLHVPLKLTTWQMSNRASDYSDFDLMELQLDARDDLDAMKKAAETRKERKEAGLNDDPDTVYAGWDKLDNASMQELADFYLSPNALPKVGKAKPKDGAVNLGKKAIEEAIAQATKRALESANQISEPTQA